MSEEENERDFMKTCFNVVAGLEVKNESQAIVKEVILDEVENLTKENQKYKEVIDKAIDLIEKSGTTDTGIDSNNNIIHYHQLTEDETGELLDILKEVE